MTKQQFLKKMVTLKDCSCVGIRFKTDPSKDVQTSMVFDSGDNISLYNEDERFIVAGLRYWELKRIDYIEDFTDK